MKKSTLLSVLTFLFLATNLKAQNTAKELYDPYTPEYFTGTDPAWLQDIQKNPRGVNFFEMEKKFQEWLSTDPDAKKKTVDKKPAVNFYRRWQRAYRPFVNSKGEIVLPTKEAYFKKLDAQNQQANRQLSAKRRKRSATTNQWKSIGPFKTARNTSNDAYQESYDSHANVFRIDVSKKNPNVLYCGAETGAVFKTTNKGVSWQACNPTYNFGEKITAIKIDPNNDDTVWVGSDAGLFVSRDGGTTFERVGTISKVNSIRVSKDNSNMITIATEDGFYVYNAYSNSYRKTFYGKCYDHELKPGSNYTVYLLAQKEGSYETKLYTSYDNGYRFDGGNNILTDVKFGRLAVSEAKGGENYLYALVNTTKYGYHHGLPHIVKSIDGGKTWEDKTVVTTNKYERKNTFCPSIDGAQGGQGYYDMMIGVSGTNPEHVIFGLCSAYRSFDGGNGSYLDNAIGGYCNPNLPGNPKIHADMQDIAVVGDEVWIANDGGIKYSDNFFENRTGKNRIYGIYTADFHGFGQGWNEDIMVGGRWHNGDAVMINNEKYDYGKTSVYVGGVEKATGYVMLSNPYKVYFSDSGMFTMPNSIKGEVIKHNERFYTSPFERLKSHGFFATDPRYAKRMLYHSLRIEDRIEYPSYKIIETTDEGKEGSYKELLFVNGERFSNVEFARSNPNIIYACGNQYVYKSEDNGESWEKLPQIPESIGFKYAYEYSNTSYLSIDPKDENKLWVVQADTEGAVAYSEDGGQTWQNPLSDALKQTKFRWVVLAGDEKNGVYLGTEYGAYVYYKDDTMPDWISYSNGLPPAARLTRLVPFFKEGKLRAATNQGIWEVPLYHSNFKPVAQPLALDLAGPELANANTPVQFESYSIVNQTDATWEWSFNPSPYSISDKNSRNPRVVFKYNGEYDVTLKITTPQGSHSRTIPKMIIVKNGTQRPSEPETPIKEKKFCFKKSIAQDTAFNGKVITSSKNNTSSWISAFLKMESTDKPFIITRLTTAQRDNIKDPKEGMLIWNTTSQKLDLYKGDKWQEIAKSCNE